MKATDRVMEEIERELRFSPPLSFAGAVERVGRDVRPSVVRYMAIGIYWYLVFAIHVTTLGVLPYMQWARRENLRRELTRRQLEDARHREIVDTLKESLEPVPGGLPCGRRALRDPDAQVLAVDVSLQPIEAPAPEPALPAAVEPFPVPDCPRAPRTSSTPDK